MKSECISACKEKMRVTKCNGEREKIKCGYILSLSWLISAPLIKERNKLYYKWNWC